MAVTKMLLRRSAPKPDENLMGYIMRLTELNGYDTPSWILGMMALNKYALTSKCGFVFSDGAGADGLSVLTGVDKSRLLPLYYRPASANTSGALKNLVFSQPASQFMLRSWRTKVCPACLREDEYVRMLWDMAPVTVCPVHKAMLLDQCPGCGKHLTWVRNRVSVCQCDCDWRTFQSRPVVDAELKMTERIYRLCGLTANNHSALIGPDNPCDGLDLDNLTTALFFIASQYREAFGRKVGARGGVDVTGKYLAPSHSNEELHVLLNKAFAVFGDWPNSYCEFLDWLRTHRLKNGLGRKTRSHSGVWKDFGGFYEALYKKLPSSQYDFLRIGFESYLAERWDGGYATTPRRTSGVISERAKYVSKSEAKRRLRTDPVQIEKFITDGRLKADVRMRGRKRMVLIEASSVAALQRELDQVLSLKGVNGLLGVGSRAVNDLIELDCLTPLRKGVKAKYVWLFAKESIDLLLDNLRRRVRADAGTGDVLPFSYASQRAGCVGQSTGQIVRAILDGALVPCAMETADGLPGLKFTADELRRYFGKRLPERDGGLMSADEAAAALNCDKYAVSLLVRKGILPAAEAVSPSRATFIPSSAVASFAKEYVAAKRLARRYGTSILRLLSLLEGLGIRPVTGPVIDGGKKYFYKSAEVERADIAGLIAADKAVVHPKAMVWGKYRLNTKQVEAKLGLDATAVCRLIERGVLIPCQAVPAADGSAAEYAFGKAHVKSLESATVNLTQLISMTAAAAEAGLSLRSFYRRWVEPGHLRIIRLQEKSSRPYLLVQEVESVLKRREMQCVLPGVFDAPGGGQRQAASRTIIEEGRALRAQNLFGHRDDSAGQIGAKAA